jgi:hypothetical protein
MFYKSIDKSTTKEKELNLQDEDKILLKNIKMLLSNIDDLSSLKQQIISKNNIFDIKRCI